MHEKEQKITYYDLDFLGKVKLSAILKMVHIAADENAAVLGFGFEEMSRTGMSFVLQRFALGVNRMPAYGETVKIRTWPDSISRGIFLRKGDMHDKSGNKIMQWASMWILFDIAARKILKPSALPIKIKEFPNLGVEISPQKIILPAEEAAVFSAHTHTVRYADVDTNLHMNNSIYGDLIGNAIFSSLENQNSFENFREVQINYLAETYFGDKIEVSFFNADDFIIVGKTRGKISFSAQITREAIQ